MKCTWKDQMLRPFELTSRNKKILMFIFLLFIMLTYAIRGWKEPWTYGYFNYTINWSNGFIPRAFVGTVLQFFLGEVARSNDFLTLLQYALAWSFLAYLGYVIYRLIFSNNNLAAVPVLLVFFTSTFCMFYLAEIGFLDHVLYLFVAVYIEICLRKNIKKCLIYGGFLSALTPLVLETGVFIVCPIIASIATIRMISESKKITMYDCRRLCITFAPTILVVLIQRLFTTSQVALDTYKDSLKAQPYYNEYMASFADLFKDPSFGIEIPKTWVYIEPEVVVYATLLIALMTLYLFFTRADTAVIIGYSILAIASGFVGYSAMYFGTDYHRYYFMVVMSTFLISLYLLRLPCREKLKCWQGALMMLIVIVILPNIISFRLWNWNQLYSKFWFVEMLR